MKLLLGLLIGIIFGFIIHRVGASQYKNIINALRLKDLKIIKFMGLSIAVGMIGIYTLNIFGLANFDIKPTYILGIAVGGLIFGVGFALSGYCPGTAVCAIGEGKKDALFTVAGGLLGAFAYSQVYPYIKPLLVDPLNFGKVTLASIIPIPSIVTAIVIGVILAVLVYKLPDSLCKEE